ncbi:Hypothetical predicted protein [Olea europaea subsp. europaea]|uniref:Uncharacterized protein n=1 Tax=Olea europaea subsp. europaea TaxID=158383 RepID=A0A8S0T2U2_OLEEU|nr:Hypothetical predicted protein [Olea europaea subsp. europaea]
MPSNSVRRHSLAIDLKIPPPSGQQVFATYSASEIPYSPECNKVVLEPPKSPDSDPNTPFPGSKFLTLHNAHFDYTEENSQKGNFLNPQSYKTQTDEVFKIGAFLHLTGAQAPGVAACAIPASPLVEECVACAGVFYDGY